MAKTANTLLDKKAILAIKDAPKKTVELPLPELGGTVYIKELTAGDREELERQMADSADKNAVRATVFVASVCDAEGDRMFTVDDIEAIKDLPSAAVVKVFNKSNEVNGITPAAVDEAEKN